MTSTGARLKVAIVGCGKIADGHVEAVQARPDRASLVAVCDIEPLMAEQLAGRYRLPRYYDRFDELLDRERPDVVHVTTSPQSHAMLTKTALAAGCHVYVEKPFALNQGEAAEMIASAEAAQRKITVGHSVFFDPPARALRELVTQGLLGTPVHVESFYGYDLSGQFGRALLADSRHWVHRLPGKLFQNIIDHVFNKVAEFVPDDPPAVHAFATALRPQRYGDERDNLLDELRVLVKGERTTGYGTFSAHIRPQGHFLHVYGTHNSAHVDFAARTVTLDCTAKLPSALGRLLPAFQQGLAYLREGSRNVLRFARSDFHYFSGLHHLIGLFYDSVQNDAPLPIPYREILRVSGMLDEIFRQVPQMGGAR